MKSKKILGLLLVVTLLSATVFGTTSVFAAGAQTNVKLESYMPPVKTIFVDDDFENRMVGSDFGAIEDGKSVYSKPVYSAVKGIEVAQDTAGSNKYAIYKDTYKRIDLCKNNISASAKKMVISFKLNLTDVANGGVILLRGDTATKAFMFQKSSKNKGLTMKIYNSSGSALDWSTVNGVNDNWIDVAIILEKVGENAECKNILINGDNIAASKDLTNKKLLPGFKWWVDGDTKNFINVTNQNNDSKGSKIDNVLIYEPYDVYMTGIDAVNKTVKIVNDGSDAVTGNVFIALYDENKNLLAAKEASTELSVQAGGSQTVSLNDETFGHPDAKTAKIFFWNKSSLAPLCAAETVSLLP